MQRKKTSKFFSSNKISPTHASSPSATPLLSKLQRNLKDFQATDVNGRSLLHRAALSQNSDLLIDIISDFEQALFHLPLSASSPSSQISPTLLSYLNSPDKFGNPPILNCLVNELDHSGVSRKKCLEILLGKGADINVQCRRTLWNAAFWAGHHGDIEVMKILLEQKNLDIHKPDRDGLFPLDIAGRWGHQAVGRLLMEELRRRLAEYEKGVVRRDKWWEGPLLKNSLFFWMVKMGGGVGGVIDVCRLRGVIVECPMWTEHEATVFHVAAQGKQNEVLEKIMEDSKGGVRERKDFCSRKNYTKFVFDIEENEVLSLQKAEVKRFSGKFVKLIKKFAKWKFAYEKEIKERSLENMKIFYDCADSFGNTPLHLATMAGNEEGVRMLLKSGCSRDNKNKEGFAPQELTFVEGIKMVYDEVKFEGSMKNKNFELKKIQVKNQFRSTLMKNLETKNKNFLIKSASQIHASVSVNAEEVCDKVLEKSDLFTPDLVIRFKKKTIRSNKNSEFLGHNPINDENSDRINFYLGILINAKFQVYLAPSFEENYFYVMLSLTDDELYAQCQNLKLKLKLIDSYNFDVFEKKRKSDFEPLRSRQRQEIITKYLEKFIDLEMLKREGLVETYFLMHNYGGIDLIKKKWIDEPRSYWPQPLNQLDDYLLEGKSQNFGSVTSLRQYLGEKISFFFAWKSYMTCFLIFLAIPGLILQIYIIHEKNYNSDILPFWVFYVSILSTLIVEFWKRKSAEINTRWGVWNFDDESENFDEVRKEFSGDEYVHPITGQVTKFHEMNKTFLIYLSSLPILIILLGGCVGTFFLTELYKEAYALPESPNRTFHNIIGSVLNAVCIVIVNSLYMFMARWFVKRENHKFAREYEKSLVVKSFAFRIINSFFAVFYVGFIKSDFEQLFLTLAPILIYKQVSNLALQVLLPWIIFNWKKKKYFVKVVNNGLEQHKINQARSLNESDSILSLANAYGRSYLSYWNRGVFLLNTHKLQSNIDMDAVELNCLRADFADTVDYFSESFISFGYVTMFTAAFPIGPVIAIAADTFELKWKIFSFLFAFKRPRCERSAGLGIWIEIWEGMSLISVISNFLLIFFNKKIQFKLMTLGMDGDEVSRLWGIIVMVAIIMLVKFGFRAIIDDKPHWVVEEQQRERAKLEKKEDRKAGDHETDINSPTQRMMSQLNEQKEHYEGMIQMEREKTFMLMKKLEKVNDESRQLFAQKQVQIPMNATNSSLFYKSRVLGIFEKTFFILERELLSLRMGDIAKLEGNLLFICENCHKIKAVFECFSCKLFFCKLCLQEKHTETHRLLGKEEPIVCLINEENYAKTNDLPAVTDCLVVWRNDCYEKFGRKVAFEEKRIITKQIKKEKPRKFDWRKFENFSFPIYQKNRAFESLPKVFDLLRSTYVKINGILSNETQIDLEAFFQHSPEINDQKENFLGKGFKEIRQKIKKIKNRCLDEFLKFENFNVEDKLFLNRLAYAVFRKNGPEADFEGFYNKCKKLQEGKFLPKLLILLEFIDHDGKSILRSDLQNLINASFIRNLNSNEKTESYEIIAQLFEGNEEITKQTLISFLDNKENEGIIGILEVLLQTKQDKKE